jgi:fermentation-respiration switch protein FrsA (DUF1100 family)
VFNHGRSFGPQQHTNKLTITEAAQILGRVFVKHGYVFLYLFRRGEGLSLRALLLAAVGKMTVPVLLIHTANDDSVTPGKSMADEFARLSKPHELKMYPPVGQTTSDSHNFLYTVVALWEDDVFKFLAQKVRH